MNGIYLDFNATTPMDERVLEALLPYYTEKFANASSTDHAPGNQAREAVEAARAEVARLVGAEAEEVVFTSGATEANNIAVLGAMQRADGDAELVVSAIEHPAVLEPARQFGSRLTILPVDGDGVVDPSEVRKAITPRTALVCVMAANNETGAIQPLAEIGGLCADAGVAFHVDAVQAAARMPLDVRAIQASSLALSAHKMYGPKGTGALFVRRRRPRAKLAPVSYGGGHERNLRPGTLNVPGIVGMGAAAMLARVEGPSDWTREVMMRDSLADELRSRAPAKMVLHAATAPRLPQTLNLRFRGITAAAILHAISDRVAIATGSACSTTSVEPSHVLLAQGLEPEEIRESLRVSFGRQTTHDELHEFVEILVPVLSELRSLGERSSVAA